MLGSSKTEVCTKVIELRFDERREPQLDLTSPGRLNRLLAEYRPYLVLSIWVLLKSTTSSYLLWLH